MTASDAAVLAAQVEQDLGHDESRWFNSDGYESVALAVLDSIYSTGNHYTSVLNAVEKYRRARREEGADPNIDTAKDLVDATERWGGIEGLVARTNRCRAWARKTAPYKAEAAVGASRILTAHGLNTRADVQAALTDPANQDASPLKAEWKRLPGQSSLLTWTYFLMLCGVPGVKADRMIVAYVSNALGRQVGEREAATLVSDLASHLQVSRTKLDHAIWRKESGREIYLPSSEE